MIPVHYGPYICFVSLSIIQFVTFFISEVSAEALILDRKQNCLFIGRRRKECIPSILPPPDAATTRATTIPVNTIMLARQRTQHMVSTRFHYLVSTRTRVPCPLLLSLHRLYGACWLSPYHLRPHQNACADFPPNLVQIKVSASGGFLGCRAPQHCEIPFPSGLG